MMRALIWFFIGFGFMLLLGIGSARAAWCVTPTDLGNGYSAILIPSSGAQSTSAALTACSTPIIVSQAEYASLMAQSELWGLSPEQGSQIAAAILLVWGIAFVFRLLNRALSVGDNSTERNETS